MEISYCRKVCVYNMKNYREEKRYVGHRDQLIRAKRMTIQEGKATGVKMIEVYNRSGMNFDVNESRGLDITNLSFMGENCSFVTPCGVVAPEYFDDKELGFLKSFTAGFMTTCGLKIAGAPCEYEGKSYGLHGNVSHTPAEEVVCTIEEEADVPYILIKGKMRDAQIFDDKLVLEREIKCAYKERKISIHDKVSNDGYQEARNMMLYHCNIGYPMLTPDSEIFIPSADVKARTEHSLEGIEEWMKAQEPDPAYEEMCYYHTLKKDNNNFTTVAVYNDDLDMGIAIEFDATTLDHFVQWKMMGAGQYVMGLEPSNTTIDGIEDSIQNGAMKYIQPQESLEYTINIYLLNSRSEFENIKQKY